jgi:hypothetical protein
MADVSNTCGGTPRVDSIIKENGIVLSSDHC